MPELITGPFHLISIYHTNGYSMYTSLETVTDLKNYIIKTMNNSPPCDVTITIPSDEDCILLWIHTFIKYGDDCISAKADYGCQCIISNDFLVHRNNIYDIENKNKN